MAGKSIKPIKAITDGTKRSESLKARVREHGRDAIFQMIDKAAGSQFLNGRGTKNKFIAKFGKFGPFIQKGEGENAQFASLGKGQLIESITLSDAMKLFQLPRTVGTYEGIEIVAMKGRFGPYLKYGDKNFSLPRGKDPLKITLEECIEIISQSTDKTSATPVLIEYKDSDIQVINGRYGPYIKHAGSNFRIPKGTDVSKLSEEECLKLINNSKPSEKGRRRFKKS